MTFPATTYDPFGDSSFGKKMLCKMGWSAGKGLGKNEDGRESYIRVKHKANQKGLGFVENELNWVSHQVDFESLLSKLNGGQQAKTELKGVENRSRSLKGKIHYTKHIRSKDLSQKNKTDVDAIFLMSRYLKEKEEEDLGDVSTQSMNEDTLDKTSANKMAKFFRSRETLFGQSNEVDSASCDQAHNNLSKQVTQPNQKDNVDSHKCQNVPLSSYYAKEAEGRKSKHKKEKLLCINSCECNERQKATDENVQTSSFEVADLSSKRVSNQKRVSFSVDELERVYLYNLDSSYSEEPSFEEKNNATRIGKKHRKKSKQKEKLPYLNVEIEQENNLHSRENVKDTQQDPLTDSMENVSKYDLKKAESLVEEDLSSENTIFSFKKLKKKHRLKRKRSKISVSKVIDINLTGIEKKKKNCEVPEENGPEPQDVYFRKSKKHKSNHSITKCLLVGNM